MEECDAYTVERMAHTLKGAAAGMCAMRVRDAAFVLEKLGRSEDLSEAKEALRTLNREIALLKATADCE